MDTSGFESEEILRRFSHKGDRPYPCCDSPRNLGHMSGCPNNPENKRTSGFRGTEEHMKMLKGGARTVATPGFIGEDQKTPVDHAFVLEILSAGKEPSMVIGKPDIQQASVDDEGRTVNIPAPFKFYAIRDDHPQDCDCGCGGGSIFTFLLPEEY